MICTDTDYYVNALSTIKKEKEKNAAGFFFSLTKYITTSGVYPFFFEPYLFSEAGQIYIPSFIFVKLLVQRSILTIL